MISASAAVSSDSSCSLSPRAASLARRRAPAPAWRSLIGRIGGRETGLLLVETGQARLVVGDHALFAEDVVAELGEPPVEIGEAHLDPCFLGIERLAGEKDALQGGAGAGGGIAEVRQCAGRHRLVARGPCLLDSASLGNRSRLAERGFGVTQSFVRGKPAKVQGSRFRLADLAGKVSITDRLAGLALQGFELCIDLGDHVVERPRFCLGGAEPELGFVAAVVQAGNAGGLFEERAAVLRLRGDQLADLALADDRRRMRAGRGVGEEELHVAGAHFATVDPVDRAGLALDPAA